jgi:hypothetical protein
VSAAEVLRLDRPQDVGRWEELVDASPTPDVYYRPGYIGAYVAAGHGDGVGVVLDVEGSRVLMPLLLRRLDDLPFAHDVEGFDAISPYGYGALLPLDDRSIAPTAMANAIGDWCRARGVIDCLLRLHPLLRQAELLASTDDTKVSIHALGPTVSLPIGLGNEELLRKMSDGRRSDLATARRSLRISWSRGSNADADIRIFCDLYEQTMARVGASAFYHFPLAYYDALTRGLGDRVAVALAWHGHAPVGGAMFLADRTLAHYHLSGTDDDGRRLKATTLLIVEGTRWARGLGCGRLHLGGGAGSIDSLFDFKRSFGGERHEYRYATVVADPSRYARLVEQRKSAALDEPRTGFFPTYRG